MLVDSKPLDGCMSACCTEDSRHTAASRSRKERRESASFLRTKSLSQRSRHGSFPSSLERSSMLDSSPGAASLAPEASSCDLEASALSPWWQSCMPAGLQHDSYCKSVHALVMQHAAVLKLTCSQAFALLVMRMSPAQSLGSCLRPCMATVHACEAICASCFIADPITRSRQIAESVQNVMMLAEGLPAGTNVLTCSLPA